MLKINKSVIIFKFVRKIVIHWIFYRSNLINKLFVIKNLNGNNDTFFKLEICSQLFISTIFLLLGVVLITGINMSILFLILIVVLFIPFYFVLSNYINKVGDYILISEIALRYKSIYHLSFFQKNFFEFYIHFIILIVLIGMFLN
jgi:hypothetical protein